MGYPSFFSNNLPEGSNIQLRIAATTPTWILASLTTGIVFLVYFLSLAPDLTLAFYGADGGELITAAATLGVPHPPGYPLYVIIGFFFSLLPVVPLALRFNLLSALSMSVAAGCITAAAFNVSERRSKLAAIAAGLIFAWIPLTWEQSVIAEVYGLNAAFLGLALVMTRCQRHPLLVGLLAGLSLASHLTSILAFPLFFIQQRPSNWTKMGAGILLAQLLWLWPALAASGNSPVIWGDPTTIQGWAWLVSADLYRPNLFSVTFPEMIQKLRSLSFAPTAQLIGAVLLSISGVLKVDIWSSEIKFKRQQGLATLGVGALFFLLALGYDSRDWTTLLIPAVLILSPFSAVSLGHINKLALILPLFLVSLNFNTITSASRPSIRQEVEPLLKQMPPDALVISDGRDETTFTLWYFHYAEGLRPDIILVDKNLFAFDWYRARLASRYPELSPLFERDDLENLQKNLRKDRSVCSVSLAPNALQC